MIDFLYTPSTYHRQVVAQGCFVAEISRLSSVHVKVNATLVRQYDLTYSQLGNEQPLLQTITEKGSDGTALPPTSFAYNPVGYPISVTAEQWITNSSLDANLNQNNTTVADVNGDGLLDIVKTEQNGGSATWKVLPHTGSSWSTTWQLWVNNAPIDAYLAHTQVRLVDVTGDSLPDIVKGASGNWKVFRNTGTRWNTTGEVWVSQRLPSEVNLEHPRITLVDVTGDTLPDIVRTWWNGQQQWEIYRNTGSTWNTAAEVWSFSAIGQGLDDPAMRVMDVTGDGLADLVWTTFSGTNATWYVWKNHGKGWNPESEHWISNANIDAHFLKDTVTVTDVTGDGLPDIVKAIDSFDTADSWQVLLNLGNRWATTWQTWIAPASNVGLDTRYVRIADATGDGIADVIDGHPDGNTRVTCGSIRIVPKRRIS